MIPLLAAALLGGLFTATLLLKWGALFALTLAPIGGSTAALLAAFAIAHHGHDPS